MELPIDIYDPSESGGNSDEKVRFLWFRLLIDVLINIEETFKTEDILIEYRKENPAKEDDEIEMISKEFIEKYAAQLPMKQFVKICREHFVGNDRRLRTLDEFEANYEGSKSIFWYTREPFIYRLLNKALRYQNIDFLYQYRFLIRDLFNQLNARKDLSQSSFHLYRGQTMFDEEFQRISRNTRQFLRINSFFSTSKDKQIALGFAMSSINENDPHQRAVLFDIETNTKIGDTRPYADISHLSQHYHEAEVLFMCGTVFQLQNVTYDSENNIWLVVLKLCSEDEYELKQIYEQFQQQYVSEQRNLNLIELGNILKDIGDDKKAEKYYSQFLNSLNENDPHIQRCYHNFGILAYRKSDLSTALTYFQQALDLELQWDKCEPSFLCNIYNWMGNVYYAQENLDKAFENYKQALTYKSELDCRDRSIETAACANLANMYTLRGEYQLALEKHHECLNLKLSFLPEKDPAIAASKVNIGFVHRRMKDYTKAMDLFREALEIQRESLSRNHPDMAITFHNMGTVEEELHHYDRACENYIQAIEIFPPTHPFRTRTLQALSQIKCKLGQGSSEMSTESKD